ncbi:MAG TPA: single-stranded DNA-binding protein, partial [Saprospiraceae bacterium]|nr:single-stranded DNA-binding protein [Saprospiraceae bacterium]
VIMTTLRNSVQLVGHLGNDVEIKKFESGTQLANFSLATNEYFKNAQGEKEKVTQWHNIVAWGKLADNMSSILSKGTQVIVHGKLNYRNYTAKDGSTKYITEIVASDFIKLDSSEKTQENLPF